jgi:hypothetical protein
MKTINAIAALAAATSVYAAPSPTEQLSPRASTLTAITVKGNGTPSIDAIIHQSSTNISQLFSREPTDSISVVSIINLVVPPSSSTLWLIRRPARVISPNSRSLD